MKSRLLTGFDTFCNHTVKSRDLGDDVFDYCNLFRESVDIRDKRTVNFWAHQWGSELDKTAMNSLYQSRDGPGEILFLGSVEHFTLACVRCPHHSTFCQLKSNRAWIKLCWTGSFSSMVSKTPGLPNCSGTSWSPLATRILPIFSSLTVAISSAHYHDQAVR